MTAKIMWMFVIARLLTARGSSRIFTSHNRARAIVTVYRASRSWHKQKIKLCDLYNIDYFLYFCQKTCFSQVELPLNNFITGSGDLEGQLKVGGYVRPCSHRSKWTELDTVTMSSPVQFSYGDINAPLIANIRVSHTCNLAIISNYKFVHHKLNIQYY